jgi:CBS domain-containing protein
MFSQRIGRVMEREKMLTASPRTTVIEAVKRMASQRVGAVLVVDNEGLAGIFTERDAVFRVMAQERDAQATLLADVMTPSPLSVDPDKTFGFALHLMHEHGLRHMPVVQDGKPVGIVSARDALDPDLEEFVSEARRREGLR